MQLRQRPQMRPRDREAADEMRRVLNDFREVEALPGLSSDNVVEVLIAQLIESDRRKRYLHYLRDADPSERVLEPDTSVFDPLMGAVLRARQGEFDEACWLVFLAVHFGYHRRHRWTLFRNFYGRLGQGGIWDWRSVQLNIKSVRAWLDDNQSSLKEGGLGFGNHRKYETLSGTGPNGTGETIESYVGWVGESHAHRFAVPHPHAGDPAAAFAYLFTSLNAVNRFGRTAKFDYLSTLGNLGLVEIQPDRAHISGATGPLAGARLLFEGSRTAKATPSDLEARLALVQAELSLSFDVLEDALCNWQKSPNAFISFRG
jgi:hypothetical protein